MRVADMSYQRWPAGWRLAVIALGTAILCSCRGPARRAAVAPPPCPPQAASLPESAYTGMPMAYGMHAADGSPFIAEDEIAMPRTPGGPWAPPGFRQPWPADEYLRDGGDRGLPAAVGREWEMHNLDVEDTVAHFDTLDGKTVVAPSNRVHIYAPRFGAVRQVVGLVANEQMDLALDKNQRTTLVAPASADLATTYKQNLETNRQIGTKPPVLLLSEQGDGVVSTATKARGFQDGFLPHENLKLIRLGIFDGTDMARLARATTAAIAWSGDQAVQVILDHRGAMALNSDQPGQEIFTVKEPPAAPKLRVVKVASVEHAEPGDEVVFSIRFDNVGNQVIGNVTIIDNLTTRLEYVADSAECSLEATFSTQPNEGGSLVIRCEVTDPLPAGEGGIVRFRCRVR